MRGDFAEARRDVEFRRGIKCRHKTPRDHVEDLRFRVVEVFRFRRRRNDGEVIADLGVVEDALVRLAPNFLERLLGVRLQRAGKIAQRLLNDRQIILRQGARIGARISQHLVPLVECLGDLERALGGETVASVRLALQRRQIVETRRDLRAGFLFLGNGGDGLALARGDDRFGGAPDPKCGRCDRARRHSF